MASVKAPDRKSEGAVKIKGKREGVKRDDI